MDVARAFAHKIIKNMNLELQEKGFVTISKGDSRKNEERVYGITETAGSETNVLG